MDLANFIKDPEMGILSRWTWYNYKGPYKGKKEAEKKEMEITEKRDDAMLLGLKMGDMSGSKSRKCKKENSPLSLKNQHSLVDPFETSDL